MIAIPSIHYLAITPFLIVAGAALVLLVATAMRTERLTRGRATAVALVAALAALSWTESALAQAPERRPNILIILAVLLLPLEILKATRIGVRSIVDHMLSMALFVAMLVEFLLVRQAGTSTFFIIMMVAVVDVIAGFTVTLRTAQRDMTIEKVEAA